MKEYRNKAFVLLALFLILTFESEGKPSISKGQIAEPAFNHQGDLIYIYNNTEEKISLETLKFQTKESFSLTIPLGEKSRSPIIKKDRKGQIWVVWEEWEADRSSIFLGQLKENKIIPDNLKMGNVKGAGIPNRPAEKTYADRVLLCGDAGGLVNPISGDGIDFAMSSGVIAADVITEALETGDTSANFLSKYEKIWKNEFGRDIKFMLKFQKSWRKKSKDMKIIKFVSRDKILSQIVVETITGNCRIDEIKFKVARRLLYLYIKNLLHKT